MPNYQDSVIFKAEYIVVRSTVKYSNLHSSSFEPELFVLFLADVASTIIGLMIFNN